MITLDLSTQLAALLDQRETGVISNAVFAAQSAALLNTFFGSDLGNAALAASLSAIAQTQKTRDAQSFAWINGTLTGGPNGDGFYPFTDVTGHTTLIASPARLAAPYQGPKGEPGTNGTNGVSVVSMAVNGGGHLIIGLSNGQTIDAGYVVGPQGPSIKGDTGLQGVSVTGAAVNGSGHLIVTLSSGQVLDLGSVIGPQGPSIKGDTGLQGVSVTAAVVNGIGHLIVTLSTGATIDAGNVVGPQGTSIKGDTGNTGLQGVSVVSGTVNGSGHLILTLSNGATIDAGYVIGAAGSGSGNVNPTGSVASGNLTAFADTSGNLIKDSGVTADSGNLHLSGGFIDGLYGAIFNVSGNNGGVYQDGTTKGLILFTNDTAGPTRYAELRTDGVFDLHGGGLIAGRDITTGGHVIASNGITGVHLDSQGYGVRVTASSASNTGILQFVNADGSAQTGSLVTDASGNMTLYPSSGSTYVQNLNLSGVLNGLYIPGTNGIASDRNPFGSLVTTQTNGVTELGSVIDFHVDGANGGDTGKDFSARISVDGAGNMFVSPGLNNHSNAFSFLNNGYFGAVGGITTNGWFTAQATGTGLARLTLNGGGSGAHSWTLSSYGQDQGGGSGWFALADETAGLVRLQIDQSGVLQGHAGIAGQHVDAHGYGLRVISSPSNNGVLQFVNPAQSYQTGAIGIDSNNNMYLQATGGTATFIGADVGLQAGHGLVINGAQVLGTSAGYGLYLNPGFDANVALRCDDGGTIFFQTGVNQGSIHSPLSISKSSINASVPITVSGVGEGVSARNGYGQNGAGLVAALTNRPGYLSLFNPDGSRAGYVGFSTADGNGAGRLYLSADNSAGWQVTGPIGFGGGVDSFTVLRENGADEGGDIKLQKPINSSRVGDITIDTYGDRLRFFDIGTGQGIGVNFATLPNGTYGSDGGTADILHTGAPQNVPVAAYKAHIADGQANNFATLAAQGTSLGLYRSGLAVQGPPNTPVFMTFHVPGAFATQFGLDVDGEFKVGGWSRTIAETVVTSRNISNYAGSSNYTPQGGASYSIARSVSTKLDEIISLADFGYVGGNVRADTDSLGYAIAAMYARGIPGGRIYVPPTNSPGLWDGETISSVFSAGFDQGAGITLFGAGRASKICPYQVPSSRYYWIDVQDVGLNVSDLFFIDNYSQITNGKYAFRAYGAQAMAGSSYTGNSGDGVERPNRYDGLTFQGMGGGCFYIDGATAQVWNRMHTINVRNPFWFGTGGIDCTIQDSILYNVQRGIVYNTPAQVSQGGQPSHTEGAHVLNTKIHVQNAGYDNSVTPSAVRVNEALWLRLTNVEAINIFAEGGVGLDLSVDSPHGAVLVQDIGSYWEGGPNGACIRIAGNAQRFRKIGGFVSNGGRTNVQAISMGDYAGTADIDCEAAPLNGSSWGTGSFYTSSAGASHLRIVAYPNESAPPLNTNQSYYTY